MLMCFFHHEWSKLCLMIHVVSGLWSHYLLHYVSHKVFISNFTNREKDSFFSYIHLNNLLIWWIQSTLVLFDFKKWILKVFNRMLNVELIVCAEYYTVGWILLDLKTTIIFNFELPGPLYPSSCPQASHWRSGCVQCKEFRKGERKWWWCKNNEHVGWWGQTCWKDT